MQPDDKWANFKAEREEERPKAGFLAFSFLFLLSGAIGAFLAGAVFFEYLVTKQAVAIICGVGGAVGVIVFLKFWFGRSMDDDFN